MKAMQPPTIVQCHYYLKMALQFDFFDTDSTAVRHIK